MPDIVIHSEHLVNTTMATVSKKGVIIVGSRYRGQLVVVYTTNTEQSLQKQAPVKLKRTNIVSATAGLVYPNGCVSVGKEHTGKKLHCYIIASQSYNISKEEKRRNEKYNQSI